MDPLLRSKAIEEAWKSGHLYYLLRTSQRKIYDQRQLIKDKSRKFVFCCGRGWGKSFLPFCPASRPLLDIPVLIAYSWRQSKERLQNT